MELDTAANIVAGNKKARLVTATKVLREAGYSERQLKLLSKGFYIGRPDNLVITA